MNWYITGDTHGHFDRLEFLRDKVEESAIIILGDAGFNYYLDKRERSVKDKVNSYKKYIYLVRGNHEERPENIEDHKLIYDENVKGEVWCDKKRWPYIRYFKDGGEYEINGLSILTIGGAYSVDKFYRLRMGYTWFKDEQLTEEEMSSIYENIKGKKYDIVLTHTCPFSWQPTDLFLPSVDQSTVDNKMEKWFDKVKVNIKYNLWLFGHFHDDRIVRPHVEMFFSDIQTLEDTYNRWNGKEKENIKPYWNFDPKYSSDDNMWFNN